jgi:hypothetical protein
VADLVGPLLRVLGRDFQVFGGDALAMAQASSMSRTLTSAPRSVSEVRMVSLARHGRQQLVDARFHLAM